MEFLSKITGALGSIRTMAGSFMGSDKPKGAVVGPPTGVVWARYTARMAILIVVLFIFMWWPVDRYDPTGFDAWSTRMSNLPQEVWYVLLSVILSWGTTEVMAARAVGSASSESSDTFVDNTILGDAGLPLDGRFANLSEGDDYAPATGMANPVIEEWRDEAE